MTAAWDREAALRVAEDTEWLADAFVLNSDRKSLLNAAALLRAANAEITRLRAREEAAEKMAEALRLLKPGDLPCKPMCGSVYCTCGAVEKLDAVHAALAAWDASRGEAQKPARDHSGAWAPLTGDERINQRCATEGCCEQPSFRFEAGGVGAAYCSGCASKIAGLRDASRGEAGR